MIYLEYQRKTFDSFQGITFEEFLDFYNVLKHINDIDTALMFYHVAGASIDKGKAGFSTGPRLNIKTVLSTYGDFHVKDKTAVRTSYL